MRFHRIEWFVPQSTQYLTKTCARMSTFVLAGYLQHFMCLVVPALPHRLSVSGSVGRILFGHVAGWLTRRWILPWSTVDFFLHAAYVFRKCSIKCQLPHIKRNQGIRLFAERISFKSSTNESPCGWFSKCTCSQRFRDKFQCTCWLSSRCLRHVSSRNERQVALYLTLVRFGGSEDFLGSRLEGSCYPCCKLDVITPRGNLGNWCTLRYKSSQSSCIPLSQYKSEVVCWKRQLRAIGFDRSEIFSFERASDCINILYFAEFSKCCCTP